MEMDNGVSDEYNELTDLFAKVDSLKKTGGKIAGHFNEALERLKSEGEMPDPIIADAIYAANKDFADIRAQALHIWISLSPRAGARSEKIKSINELEFLLGKILEIHQSKFTYQEQCQQALGVLDRVLSLYYEGELSFAPLEDLKSQAQVLRQEFIDLPWPHIHQEVQALAQGNHDLAGIVLFITEGNDLDDDNWLLLHDYIFDAFDKKLATALYRGKILMPPISKPKPVREEQQSGADNNKLPDTSQDLIGEPVNNEALVESPNEGEKSLI
jgi:hypothetical protein